MKLELPLENARTSGCGFGFRNMPGGLKRDGKSGVGERVQGRERGEGDRGGEGLIELAGVAEGADKAMMRFDARGVGGDGTSEGKDGLAGCSLGKEIEAALRECGCAREIVFGHGYE